MSYHYESTRELLMANSAATSTMTTLASVSSSMHPTVSPTSSNDSDFSVASLANGLPQAASPAAHDEGASERDEGYNEDPVVHALRRYSQSLAQYTADRFEESESAAVAEDTAAGTATPSAQQKDDDRQSKSKRSERDAAAAMSRGMSGKKPSS